MTYLSIRDTSPRNAIARTLMTVFKEPSTFDPSSAEDRIAYLVYRKSGRWIKKFRPELPFYNVPDTVENKLMLHFLKKHEAKADEIISKFNKPAMSISA